ncbi:MAG TPA: peptidase MA family metallohydrolase [bacterium]|nr:peptidase MA family metallohydrolase [bacterium]HOC88041.1 peptidase MA family metallohydrolase [bacterium]HOZ21046.1 peptidase MA family metallohydrolase [bacterium]
MKRRALLLLVLLLSLFRLTTAAEVGEIYLRHCSGTLCIYYTAEDSRLLEETRSVLQRACEEIERDLHLSPADTLRIIIAPSRESFRTYIHGNMPEWTQAFAVPATSTMVVRSPRWDRPESSYSQSLVHELFHLLLHQRLGIRELPRWLDEGMAVFYSEHAQYEKRSLISRALATGSLIPLQEIDDVLSFHRERANLAYEQSYSAVRYLLATYDIEALRTILEGYAAGESSDMIFMRATGSTVSGFEAEWRAHLEKTEKWLWLSEADDLIWLSLPLLFLIAVYFVRRRNRRRLREWEGARPVAEGAEPDRPLEEGGGYEPPWMAPHLMPRRDDEDEEEEKPQGETAEEDNGIKS